jgi:3-oxoacyl-[acyl-carrier-protein] synthase III
MVVIAGIKPLKYGAGQIVHVAIIKSSNNSCRQHNVADIGNLIWPFTVKEYGNTGPASIPLTLCDSYSDTKELGKAVFSGFGVGLSWGSIALNLNGVTLLEPMYL